MPVVQKDVEKKEEREEGKIIRRNVNWLVWRLANVLLTLKCSPLSRHRLMACLKVYALVSMQLQSISSSIKGSSYSNLKVESFLE